MLNKYNNFKEAIQQVRLQVGNFMIIFIINLYIGNKPLYALTLSEHHQG